MNAAEENTDIALPEALDDFMERPHSGGVHERHLTQAEDNRVNSQWQLLESALELLCSRLYGTAAELSDLFRADTLPGGEPGSAHFMQIHCGQAIVT